jgi:CheY-like chemotaxis protein
VVSTVGILIDNRTLLGINVWLKPLKFAISGSIFTLTVGYIIRLYPYSGLKKNIINNTVAVTMIIDVGIIVFREHAAYVRIIINLHYLAAAPGAAPDLAFMDIQLANGLSFEIFQKIEVKSPIIFTTAFDQYAIQAFKVNSVDYLLKTN